jgi:SnoaL-like domain
MHYLTAADARRFAEDWLPAWSGNNPERLAGFYAEDAFYVDPGIPAGVKGKSELLSYFRNLLAHNPNWVWSQIDGIPMEDGFLNKWRVLIPVGAAQLEIVGVCLVQLDEAGKIRRNEVYFDRTELLAAIAEQRAAVSASVASRAARATLR